MGMYVGDRLMGDVRPRENPPLLFRDVWITPKATVWKVVTWLCGALQSIEEVF